MTSIMLAKAAIGGKPISLVMDEDNRLSYITDNGSHYRINAEPVSLILTYQLAEQAVAMLPCKTAVNWLFDVHKKKLECVAKEKGKDRDAVYRIILAEVLVREEERDIKTRGDLKRRVAMEVRFLPLLIDDPSESDSAEIINVVEDMGRLTPHELAQLFPAEKRYDGEKYQMKDYFTSAEFLGSLEDKPLGGEGALNFMWDYMNPELNRFNLLAMKAVDNDRKRQGKPSMGEEFAKEAGVPLYKKTTDADGNPVLIDDSGNVIPLG